MKLTLRPWSRTKKPWRDRKNTPSERETADAGDAQPTSDDTSAQSMVAPVPTSVATSPNMTQIESVPNAIRFPFISASATHSPPGNCVVITSLNHGVSPSWTKLEYQIVFLS